MKSCRRKFPMSPRFTVPFSRPQSLAQSRPRTGRRFGPATPMLATLLCAAGLLGAQATPARAELVRCETSIRGEALAFVYDPDNAALKDSRSRRERLFGPRGEVTCPGLVTLRALTPELDDAGRAGFCLQWDRKAGTYLGYAPGGRDAFLNCRAPSRGFCERVNGSAAAAWRILGNSTGIAAEMQAQAEALPGGAVVLRGQGEKIGRGLVKLGAETLGAAATSNPAALTAVAVSAVAVGGAVYLCSDRGAQGADLAAAPGPQLQNGTVVAERSGAEQLGAELPAQSPGVSVPMMTLPVMPQAAPSGEAPGGAEGAAAGAAGGSDGAALD